ncbi:MAG TPA: GntR family transcriptional regulator [bacterium]|nr:GntR family transcriptional regulator [bacterium]
MLKEKSGCEQTTGAVGSEVHRVSLTDQVIAVLRKEIFTGVYQPGDKLPPERELAERFGISRSTLRKALLLLAQEGWIEIVQGRSNAVKDFRTSVGIEVLPDLFFESPEAVISLQLLETMTENGIWECQQIMIAASKNATAADEPLLMAILERQTDQTPITEFYENEFQLYRELLRIGGDLILQMTYNSEVRLSRKLLALGIVKEPPFPLQKYHEINRGLIQAVCAHDVERIKTLVESSKPDVRNMFVRIVQNMGRNRSK